MGPSAAQFWVRVAESELARAYLVGPRLALSPEVLWAETKRGTIFRIVPLTGASKAHGVKNWRKNWKSFEFDKIILEEKELRNAEKVGKNPTKVPYVQKFCAAADLKVL